MASGAESVVSKQTCDYSFKFLLIGGRTTGKTGLFLRYFDGTYTSAMLSTVGLGTLYIAVLI